MCDSWPESGSSSPSPRQPGANELVAARSRVDARVRARRARSAAPGRARPGAHAARDARRARSSDERRDRVPRQPEDERPRRARPNASGFPGLTDTPQNTSSTPSSASIAAHEVVRADRDAAGRDEHVVARAPARSRHGAPPRRPPPSRAARPRARARRRAPASIAPVRLVDLARPERLAGPPELRAGREHGDARTARALAPRRRPRRRARRSAAGPSRDAGLDDDVARDHVAAARPHVRARGQPRPGSRPSSPSTTTRSIGTTASAPSGTTPPVAIPIASPGASGRAAGRPAATRSTTGRAARACPRHARRTRPSPSSGTAAGRQPPAPALGEHASRRLARAARARRAAARTRASDGLQSASSTERSSAISEYAIRRDLGRRPRLQRGAERRAPLRGAAGGARPARPRRWEAVFVDDGSTDGSFAALTRLHALHDNVRVVRLRRNFGKSAALAAGFGHAAAT